MNNKRKVVIGLLIAMGVVFAGAGSVSAQTAADADFDDSGEVGFQDFLLFAAKFGLSQGDADYDARFDLDGSGAVGFADFLAFARLFGETVPVPALALTGIAPSEGMPGTLIELVGQFDADTAYQVKFGTVLLPAFAQNAERMTAMVPVLESGSVPVLVVDPSGRESEPTSFEVLALPEPRMNPEQLQQAVSGVGDGIGNVLAPLTAPDSLFSAADAAMIKDEMDKLNAAWGILGQRIEALPPEDAALLTHLLDNSGALGILEGLGTIDLSASKAVGPGAAFGHQKLFQADVVSFLMGNASAATSVATVIAAVVPGGQALVPILAAIDAVSGATKAVIDAIFPTDLENLRVEISPTPVPVEGTSDVSYYGDFVTESDAISALGGKLLEDAVEELLESFLKIPKVSEAAAEEIVGFVSGILSAAGMKGFDWITGGATISPALKDVPLDMSVYRLSVFDLLQVIPTLPGKETADAIEYLLGKAGIDVTFFDPVVVENEAVAAYDRLNARLTGKRSGATRLTVRAIRFVEWDSWWNWLGVCKWETVGPVYPNVNVGTMATSSPFYLDDQNDRPRGITYANNRFYVIGGKVYAYTAAGQRDAASDFYMDHVFRRGITYADDRFFVLGHDKVHAYMNSGQRDAASDFDLDDDYESLEKITYANDRLYVVAEPKKLHTEYERKLYAYTVSGQRDAASDVELLRPNALPFGIGITYGASDTYGITYVNNRFFLVRRDKVYAYTNSGQRDAASDFDLDFRITHFVSAVYPRGITSANNRFYVLEDSTHIDADPNDRVGVYEYSGRFRPSPDLIVNTSVREKALAPGQSFTLSATVKNVGDAQASSTTLRYVRSDDWSISQDDTQGGSAAVGVLDPLDTSPVNVTLTAPSTAGTYYYWAHADVLEQEEIEYNNYSEVAQVSVYDVGTPTSTDFELANNNSPSSITYANDRFYVADLEDGKIYAYTVSGQRDTAADFKLEPHVVPLGITYANRRFYVADVSGGKVYAYTVSGQRDASADFAVSDSALTGITYANDRFFVVHASDDKVYAYTGSGQRDADSDFELDGDFSPFGLTYANDRFYVAKKRWDSRRGNVTVYAYTSSGQRDPDSDFTPRHWSISPFLGGLTYANGRFYVITTIDRYGRGSRDFSGAGSWSAEVFGTSGGSFFLDINDDPVSIAYGNNRFNVLESVGKVYTYKSSGQRDPDSDFELIDSHSGMTHANNRFYVVTRDDRGRGFAYVYTSSGERDEASDFKLSHGGFSSITYASITYADNRFYVVG